MLQRCYTQRASYDYHDRQGVEKLSTELSTYPQVSNKMDSTTKQKNKNIKQLG